MAGTLQGQHILSRVQNILQDNTAVRSTLDANLASLYKISTTYPTTSNLTTECIASSLTGGNFCNS